MDWGSLRHKIYRNEKVELSPNEMAVMLMESYERIEELEDRIKKLEAKNEE